MLQNSALQALLKAKAAHSQKKYEYEKLSDNLIPKLSDASFSTPAKAAELAKSEAASEKKKKAIENAALKV